MYLHELCCIVNKMKNYFICCSDSRKHIIFFENADTRVFFRGICVSEEFLCLVPCPTYQTIQFLSVKSYCPDLFLIELRSCSSNAAHYYGYLKILQVTFIRTLTWWRHFQNLVHSKVNQAIPFKKGMDSGCQLWIICTHKKNVIVSPVENIVKRIGKEVWILPVKSSKQYANHLFNFFLPKKVEILFEVRCPIWDIAAHNQNHSLAMHTNVQYFPEK